MIDFLRLFKLNFKYELKPFAIMTKLASVFFGIMSGMFSLFNPGMILVLGASTIAMSLVMRLFIFISSEHSLAEREKIVLLRYKKETYYWVKIMIELINAIFIIAITMIVLVSIALTTSNPNFSFQLTNLFLIATSLIFIYLVMVSTVRYAMSFRKDFRSKKAMGTIISIIWMLFLIVPPILIGYIPNYGDWMTKNINTAEWFIPIFNIFLVLTPGIKNMYLVIIPSIYAISFLILTTKLFSQKIKQGIL